MGWDPLQRFQLVAGHFQTRAQEPTVPVRELTQSCSLTVTGHFLQARATPINKVALKVTVKPAVARYIHSKPQICHSTHRIKASLGLVNLPVHTYQLSLAETLPHAWSPAGHAETPVGAPGAPSPESLLLLVLPFPLLKARPAPRGTTLPAPALTGFAAQPRGCSRHARALHALQAGRWRVKAQRTGAPCFRFYQALYRLFRRQAHKPALQYVCTAPNTACFHC